MTIFSSLSSGKELLVLGLVVDLSVCPYIKKCQKNWKSKNYIKYANIRGGGIGKGGGGGRVGEGGGNTENVKFTHWKPKPIMFFKLKNLAIENNTTIAGAYCFPSLLRNLLK